MLFLERSRMFLHPIFRLFPVLIGLLIVTLTIASTAVMVPYPILTDVDGSWVSFLSIAADRNWHAGSDFIFTYGPLGSWLWPLQVDSTLLWSSMLRAGSAICAAWYIWHEARTLRATVLSVFAIYLALSANIDHNGPILLVALVLAISSARRITPLIVVSSVLLTLWGLVKFSALILLFLTVAWCLVLSLAHRPVPWRMAFRATAASVVPSAATVIIVYVLYLDEPLLDFVEYVFWSAEISRGYTQWMSTGNHHNLIYGYIAAILAIVLFHACSLLAGGARRVEDGQERPWTVQLILSRLPVLLCAAPVVFIAFKQGFVRQDGHEAAAYVAAYVYAAFVLASAPFPDRLLTPASAAISVVWLCLAYSLVQPTASVWQQFALLPERMEQAYRQAARTLSLVHPDRLEAMRKAYSSRYDRAVSDLRKSVSILTEQRDYDIFGPEQSTAWANVDGYRPRPVFQGYSAYTPALQDLNADFMADGPESVLFGLAVIDHRFPNLEDGSALAQLLLQYCPASLLGTRVLFRRHDRPVGLEAIDRLDWHEERIDRIDGRIALPTGVVLGKVHMELSTFGKLLAAVYRLPPVNVRVEMRNGDVQIARLIPTGDRFPAILSPWIGAPVNATDLRDSPPSLQIASINLLANRYILSLFENIRIAYASAPATMFPPDCNPSIEQGPPWGATPHALSEGTTGLARNLDAHPTSRLAFRVGKVENLKATLLLRKIESARSLSNGVDVRLKYYRDGMETLVQSLRIDTATLDQEGRFVVFDGKIDLAGGYLVFETDDVDARWDWYTWDEIEVR